MNKYYYLIFKIILLICFLNKVLLPQNYWEETAGPEGGKVQCLAVDKYGTIYAGFEAGEFGGNHLGRGLYKSTDNGLSWQSISINSNKDVESITITESGIIYLWVRHSGIMKSADNGQSWKQSGWGTVDFGIIKSFKNNFVVLAQNDGLYFSKDNGTTWNANSLTKKAFSLFIDRLDNLYVSVNSGELYKTSDYGLTWQDLSSRFKGGVVSSFTEYKDSLLFAATGNGIYYSIKDEKGWFHLPNSPPGIIVLTADLEGSLYGAAWNKGFYISTDLGNNWEKRNSGLQSYYVTDLLRIASNRLVLGTYDDGVYSTTDEGMSWKTINSGIKSVSITCFLQYKDFLFAGSEQGMIYKTSDRGEIWEKTDSNYTLSSIHCFGKSNKGSLFFTNYRGIFKSKDEGKTWYRVSDLCGFSFANYAVLNSNLEYIFIASEANGIHFSTDDGDSWFPLRNPLKEMWVRSIAVNSKGDIFAVSRNKIYRTEEVGRSWEKVYQGNNEVYSSYISVASNDYIYAGFDWGGIMLSSDDGDTWIESFPNLPPNRVNSLTTDAMNRVYFGNWNGLVLQSDDEGKNWISINSGLIGGPILNLFCDDSGNIFAGPFGGSVYRNISSTFIPTKVRLAWPPQIAYNIPLTPMLKWYSSSNALLYRVQLSSNELFDSTAILFDKTQSDSVLQLNELKLNALYFWRVSAYNEYGWNIWSMTHRFQTTSTVDNKDVENQELKFQLFQNYPNPFNPSTKISWESPVSGRQTLKVYDILGNEVATLGG